MPCPCRRTNQNNSTNRTNTNNINNIGSNVNRFPLPSVRVPSAMRYHPPRR